MNAKALNSKNSPETPGSTKKTRGKKLDPRANPWVSKIVGHDKVDPSTLTKNPLNFTVHPQAQREALRSVIKEVGYLASVTVNKTTGRIINGHARVEQAIAAGQPTIDVEYVALTEEEERTALATFDALGAMAGRDDERVRELLASVQTDEVPILVLLEQISPSPGAAPPASGPGSDSPPPSIPDMELQPYEHYDYVLVLARTTHQWHQLCEALDIEPRVDSSAAPSTTMKKVGLGRCIDATRLLQKLEPQ